MNMYLVYLLLSTGSTQEADMTEKLLNQFPASPPPPPKKNKTSNKTNKPTTCICVTLEFAYCKFRDFSESFNFLNSVKNIFATLKMFVLEHDLLHQ